jgi:regulator of CtrA degradation
VISPANCFTLKQNRTTPELVCVMIESFRSPALSFARTFVSSDAFRALFREGMLLVEDTAAYLDGPGRDESRALPRDVALAYATESMRLTTRLMQIASWLLVQRAVSEGEISPDQARSEKNRVRIADVNAPTPEATLEQLPARLRELMAASQRMQARVQHLEALVAIDIVPEDQAPVASNDVANQLDKLRAAFG